jgi:hypothetical protein
LTNTSTGTVVGSFSFQAPTEFLSLAQTNVSPPFQQFGYALEIPGRALLLRPGNSSTSLAALVPGSCLHINGTVTFQFVTLPDKNWLAPSATAYGSVQVSTSASTWNFSNFSQFTLKSSSQTATTLAAGNCATNASNSAVSIPVTPAATLLPTVTVGPSGFLVADQFIPNPAGNPFGAAGVVQPSSSIDTSLLVSSGYFGFIYEPTVTPACFGSPNQACVAPTQMVAFTNSGCPPNSPPPPPTGICGGNYDLDDLKVPGTPFLMELGPEDQTNFGLYKSATIHILDPNKVCNPTGVCALPAVAIVGNPEGKFAIFLIAQDTVNNSPMVIYLFQQ